ncbi:hypothetical protein [Streptomyces sp. Wb2n-11]|uniref:hypothetical protein n=1 Tax=Streptomyces sp. Wb2n-11 TaxID=1030533 RepID=UPI000A779FF9|nr:hypothetical protein [Streptomyces sp. Wb2n-11]
MRTSIKTAARAVAVTGLTLAALGATTTAQAETRSPSGEAVTVASCGTLSRGYVCTTLSSGTLYHRKYTNDIASTWYDKDSGGSITARLGYDGAGYKWTGWFTQSAGTTKTGTWSDVSYCNATIGRLEVSGQQTFQTPLADC